MGKDLQGKNLLNCPDVFSDIGNVNLFDGEQLIHPEELEVQPTEMIYRDNYGTMRHHYLDTRMKVIQHQTEIAIFCIENQSGVNNIMPVRDMGYLYSNYSEQIRRIQKRDEEEGVLHFTEGIGEEQKLVPVISIVLYYGQENWTGPEKLSDMLTLPESWSGRLKPYIADHAVKIIHLAKQDSEVRKKYKSDFRHIVDYLACMGDREECQKYIQDPDRKICHPEEYLDMMAAFSSDTRFAEIKESVLKKIKKGEGDITMYSIAEELENIGKQKGIEQGIRQGKEETYYRMFSNNRTLEDISEFTGESMDYLYRIHEKYLDMVREKGKYESGTMSNDNLNCFYSSPIGVLKIEATEQGICAIRFLGEKDLSQKECSAPSHPLLQQAVRELDEYFRGDRQVFTLPLVPQGTPFQHSVWEALQKIPYGATCSYGEIATAIGNPKASRAVGMANNKNPLPILIPCHRVIGADGRLVGYGGGLDIKRKLLALEQGQR